MKIISMLPWADWLALFSFFALWVGYAWFARIRGKRDQSLIATTNKYRQKWMLQTTSRDPRMLDGLITQNLSQTPAFFLIDQHHHHRWSVCFAGHHQQSRRVGG